MADRLGCASCTRTLHQSCLGALLHGSTVQNLKPDQPVVVVCSLCATSSQKELEILKHSRFTSMNTVIVRVDSTLVSEIVKDAVNARMSVLEEDASYVTFVTLAEVQYLVDDPMDSSPLPPAPPPRVLGAHGHMTSEEHTEALRRRVANMALADSPSGAPGVVVAGDAAAGAELDADLGVPANREAERRLVGLT